LNCDSKSASVVEKRAGLAIKFMVVAPRLKPA